MNYYISDLHIGHTNAIKFDGRPFADVNEMNNAIIENRNSRVKTDDTIISSETSFGQRKANDRTLSVRLPATRF